MFDIYLRSVKDGIFDPSCSLVPGSVSPLHITILAFACGLISGVCAVQQQVALSLIFWTLNRALDCLDGALARHRKAASDLGGFLDLLGDFLVYSFLPIAVAIGTQGSGFTWQAVAVLEASFHVNNFILFYVAAIFEKKMAENKSSQQTKELTSLMMRPALIEGMESGILFTLMLALPGYITLLSWIMASLVMFGILQRTIWTISVLGTRNSVQHRR